MGACAFGCANYSVLFCYAGCEAEMDPTKRSELLTKVSILIPLKLTAEQKLKLEQLGVSKFYTTPLDLRARPEDLSARIDGASVIVIGNSVPIDERFLAAHPNVKAILTVTSGSDHINMIATAARGVLVQSLETYSVNAVAEKALGMLIFAANSLQLANQDVRRGNWNFRGFQGRELSGRTLAIIGYGKIGKCFAELATLLGMRVLTTNSQTRPDELIEILGNADFVSVHCSLTSRTHSLMNIKEFAAMRSGSVFMNFSRGKVINEVALLASVESGHISFAVLDVLAEEPPSITNPLIHHERVFVTPHVAWNTQESSFRRIEEIIVALEQLGPNPLVGDNSQ